MVVMFAIVFVEGYVFAHFPGSAEIGTGHEKLLLTLAFAFFCFASMVIIVVIEYLIIRINRD